MPARSTLSGVLLALALVFAGCGPDERVSISERVRVLPGLTGVSIGMRAADFRLARPDAEPTPYTGFVETDPGATLTYHFTRPCSSDGLRGDDCPIRGRLWLIEEQFHVESASGRTRFIELWGEFFDPFEEPVYCREYELTRGEDGVFSKAEGTAVHWDDASGLWVTLRRVAFPAGSPDSVRVSYRLGQGEHDHEPTETGARACGTTTSPVPPPAPD